MDSTIIGVECIDEIADAIGVGPQVAAITEQAMRGEIDFDGALTARVALLQGLPASILQEVYDTRVRLNPGARTLIATMAARGAATALVSGGFTFFTQRVAAAAGFAEHHANRLEVADGRLTGRVIPPILGREAKAERLAAVCAAAGVDAGAALAVGDGANDLAMVRAAGLGVAYHAKPALAAEADAVIAHADLTALLHLQGVPQGAWVR
jgi:phosphoserine phosphatase